MGGVPQAGLVVEDVVAQTAGCIRSPAADEVLHPSLLKRRIRWHVRVVRIVAGDEAAVRTDAVASVRKPLRVVSALGTVLRDRESRELAAARSYFRDPLDRGNRQHGLGAGGPGVGDERVAALAGRRTGIGDALVVPIVSAIVGVDLPVVTRGVVAAVAVKRSVEICELRGRRMGN